MHRTLAALLLLALAGGAAAADPDNSVQTPAELNAADDARQAQPARQPSPAAAAATAELPEKADQAALETQPFSGPQFGKSRVERRREKCRGQAQEQGLTGEALQRHLQSCVKR
jgi:hypothetical protein